MYLGLWECTGQSERGCFRGFGSVVAEGVGRQAVGVLGGEAQVNSNRNFKH